MAPMQLTEDACRVCGKEDDEEFLVLCDGCDKPYHTMCHVGCVCCNQKPKGMFNRKPAVPEGDWFCKFCAGHIPALAEGTKPVSSIFAWGDNEDGQLGLGPEANDVKSVWTPTKVHDLDGIGVLTIACCETATVILCNDANLYSAGTGGSGQLGHQDMVHEKLTKFRKLEAMTEDKRSKGEGRFEQVHAGRDFVAAITTQGHMYTWGNGEFGQLGHQENKIKKIPKKISALREMEIPVELAACGFDFTIFTSAESDDDSQFNTQKPGVFMSMGANVQGQLGDGSGKNQWVPQLLNKDGPSRTSVENQDIEDPQEFLMGRDIRILVAGKSHAAAVTTGMKGLWTWGYGESGQLGHPKPAPAPGQSKFFRSQFRVPRPRFVKTFMNDVVAQVACGGQHTLVLLQDGRLFGMGDNTNGQLGVKVDSDSDSESKSIELPVHITHFSSSMTGKLAQIACGDEYSVALTDGGDVYSWGKGQYGQLGLGEKQVGPLDTPTKIPDLPKIKKVFTGPNQVFAIEFTDETLPPPLYAPGTKRGRQPASKSSAASNAKKTKKGK
uniref:PHD-type domain-containing protein n=1 Tax=Globisporangium ultimum (strain ATCC 200006 / CBS 805.95 / DAOM BR144) TaxID=431595 RepID=K3WH42_GLOUD